MILRSAPPSPFGRKVKIAASVLGLSDRIEIVPADTNSESDALRAQNPLGKIPTLVLDDGQTLFDSRVILEYLDHLAGGGRIIPQRAEARFAALADAGAMRRHPGCIDPAGLRGALPAGSRSVTSHGSTIRPARSRARLPCSRPNRKRSIRSRMSDRSRWPAHSDIRICVSPVHGARTIRSWWRGSIASPRRCPHSNRRGLRRDRRVAFTVRVTAGLTRGSFSVATIALRLRTGN